MAERVFKASEFKAKCLKLMDDINETGDEIIITKNGEPLVKLVPLRPSAKDPYGTMRGEFEVLDDIVHFDASEDWEAIRDGDPNPV